MKAKRCIALVVMMPGLLTGCAHHEPGIDGRPEMSVEEARTIVRKSQTSQYVRRSPAKIELKRIGLSLVYQDGRSEMCRFDRITRLEQRFNTGAALLHGCPHDGNDLSYIYMGGDIYARRFVDAVYVLKQD